MNSCSQPESYGGARVVLDDQRDRTTPMYVPPRTRA